MKKNLVIVAIILSVLAVIAFAGCDMLAAQSMMDDFIDDVNAQRWSALVSYLHSDWEDEVNSGVWESMFLDSLPLDLTIATDTAATATGDEGTIFSFTIEDDGGDMKIRSISRAGMTLD